MENDYKTHKHYQAAYHAHYNTSHTPDRRAEQECAFYDGTVEEIKSLFSDNEDIARALSGFERRFCASLAAKARCLSSMITGPANFPVARAEKALASERKRSDELLEFLAKIRKVANKQESGVITSDDPQAIEKLEKELATLQEKHELMKRFNKAIKAKGATPESIKAVCPEMALEQITELCAGGRFGGKGYASFELTNSNANIKRVADRITQIKKAKEIGNRELIIGGARVFQNSDVMRLQIFFDGKPDAPMIALLKRNAFKWSPSIGCWQRQLTGNALYAFKREIKPALQNA